MQSLICLVVFIDRWASHNNNPKANQWNKMSLPIFETPHRAEFFEPFRKQLLDHYGISAEIPACPKIVYIDRQSSSRRFSNETQDALLSLFADLEMEGYGQFEHVLLEDLSVIDQIRAIADATVSNYLPQLNFMS